MAAFCSPIFEQSNEVLNAKREMVLGFVGSNVCIKLLSRGFCY